MLCLTWQIRKTKPIHGELPVLQPLPLTHFLDEKECFSQKQQRQPSLQTYLNNSFQLFTDTLMSKFQDLISKIAEKRPSRTKAKNLGKTLRKGSDRAGSEPFSESETQHKK